MKYFILALLLLTLCGCGIKLAYTTPETEKAIGLYIVPFKCVEVPDGDVKPAR